MTIIVPTITITLFTMLLINTITQTKPNNIKISLMMMSLMSLIPLNFITNKEQETTISSLPMISTPTENINISILLDLPSLTFMPVALFVTWSIIEFSTWYLSTDPNINKFIKYLMIFLMSMLIIITANNMYQMFMGWEGVGIMSFLLISWWHSRSDTNLAAMQAIIYNRIGDIGLIMTIMWLMSSSSLNMQELFMQHETMTILPTLGLVTAATGKSAQFFLHPWLPAAMEGPTPVSALLHSSTMVVAGIFLLIRLYPILQNNKIAMTTCLILGATTSMFAATSAMTQHDIKKIIALSTTSQLGLMMTSIGLNSPSLALLHMITHSFFKALLFLCSGSFIHNMNNEQDIRTMGSLNMMSPLTASTTTISNLTLMGMPFLSGFYSKDNIIETMTTSYTNSWALLITIMATALSTSYSIRMIHFILTDHPRVKYYPHKETKPMINPILRLTIGSIFVGTMTKMLTLQTTSTITMPKPIKLTTLTITIMSMMLSLDMLLINKYLSPKNPKTLITFFNQMAFFNIPHRSMPMKTLKLSQSISTELIDLWTLEKWGPKGLSNSTTTLIHLTTQQNNLIKIYMTTFSLTIILTLILTIT
uniref:NADH-ubiquinone oxidoreductase chain 5 n=1 Tax=Acrochordus granulatus TaxID=46287 RepID=Q402M1_ACRGR|nr:NADH dehydrogenase subunit 5 [Acrochordus granulatus]BAE20024.1 NADH dehydrogenase subunit 5 [Acrochordus granulatus]